MDNIRYYVMADSDKSSSENLMSIEQLVNIIETYGTKADYLDNKGVTYHISGYFRLKELGLPVEGMFITFSDGESGIIPEKYLGELDKFLHNN